MGGDSKKKGGGFGLFGKKQPETAKNSSQPRTQVSAGVMSSGAPFQWRAGAPRSFDMAGTIKGAAENGSGLVIQSIGQDPQILLPELDYAGKRVVVEAEVTVPAATHAQVYVQTPSKRRYSEDQSVALPVRAGRQRLEFSLGAFEVCGALRFDPGRLPGDYTLHTLTVRLS